MAIEYEWAIERFIIYDERWPDGQVKDDILDTDHRNKLSHLGPLEGDHRDEKAKGLVSERYVLIRDECSEFGVQDRWWAYPTDAGMPEVFESAGGHPTTVRVPRRFLAEYKKCSGEE